MMAPNMTMDIRKLTPADTRKMPTRNRLGGKIGSEGFLSHKMKAVTSHTAAITRIMIVDDPHPYWVPPHTVTKRMAVMANISNIAPRESMLCDCRRNGS